MKNRLEELKIKTNLLPLLFVLSSFIAALNQQNAVFKRALSRGRDTNLFSQHKRFILAQRK